MLLFSSFQTHEHGFMTQGAANFPPFQMRGPSQVARCTCDPTSFPEQIRAAVVFGVTFVSLSHLALDIRLLYKREPCVEARCRSLFLFSSCPLLFQPLLILDLCLFLLFPCLSCFLPFLFRLLGLRLHRLSHCRPAIRSTQVDQVPSRDLTEPISKLSFGLDVLAAYVQAFALNDSTISVLIVIGLSLLT
jgi:hypothetical protein